MGLFQAILTEQDAVISDQLNHGSTIDGMRLCKAQRHRYAVISPLHCHSMFHCAVLLAALLLEGSSLRTCQVHAQPANLD